MAAGKKYNSILEKNKAAFFPKNPLNSRPDLFFIAKVTFFMVNLYGFTELALY